MRQFLYAALIGQQVAWLDFHGMYEDSLGVYSAFKRYTEQFRWRDDRKAQMTTTYVQHYNMTSTHLREAKKMRNTDGLGW